jgi:putative flippase GtrA
MTPSRFVRFNIVGAGGIAVQLAAMWALTKAMHVPYFVATPVSVGAALLHNFAGHWMWTWRDRLQSRSDVARSFAGFLLANGAVSIVGNLVITGAIVESTPLSPVAANAIAIVMCGLVNFWLGDQVVFAPKRASYEAGRPDGASAMCAMAAAKNPTNHA